MRNIKLALRTLFKTPFVTIVAIASLALGIGANTAVYSLFDQMLLRPLERSVCGWRWARTHRGSDGWCCGSSR